jgi:hypothetical protein
MDAFLFAGVSVLLLVFLGGLTSSARLRTRRR